MSGVLVTIVIGQRWLTREGLEVDVVKQRGTTSIYTPVNLPNRFVVVHDDGRHFDDGREDPADLVRLLGRSP